MLLFSEKQRRQHNNKYNNKVVVDAVTESSFLPCVMNEGWLASEPLKGAAATPTKSVQLGFLGLASPSLAWPNLASAGQARLAVV